jgi:GTP-binding protein
MKIASAEFVVGVTTLNHLPVTNLPEFVFLGRSNVGKSSLINALSNKKNLARSSGTPGKTRELNYYLINDSLYFVDLPGFGYAKAPEQLRASWGKFIEQYLQTRKQIKLAFHLMDARHEPTELDKALVGWLDFYKIPFVVILTKADKLARSKITNFVKNAEEVFSTYSSCRNVVPFSSFTGDGKSDVLKIISSLLDSRKIPS